MTKGLAAIVAVLIGVSIASASSIVQTENFNGTPNFLRTLTFDKFDDQGGALTLQSISVSVLLNVQGGLLILDNDGENPASGSYEFGGKGDISSTDVSLLNSLFQPVTAEVEALTTGSFSLGANVGDGANDFDPSAPDGMQISGTTQSDSDSGFIASALFSQYIGLSTFDIDVSVDQWSDFGGVSGIEWAVTPVTASGTVTIVYNYVPEPATLGLLSIGGLAVLRRRRK